MACGGDDSFHDLLRRAANEYDRLSARLAFSHGAAFDLHGNAGTSAPPSPSAWLGEKSVHFGMEEVLPNGATVDFRDNIRDTLAVPVNELGNSAAVAGEATPKYSSGSPRYSSGSPKYSSGSPRCSPGSPKHVASARGLPPVLSPSFPTLLSTHAARPELVAPEARGAMVPVPQTPGTTLLPSGSLEVPRTRRTSLMPTWYREKTDIQDVGPENMYQGDPGGLYQHILARLDQLVASQARMETHNNQSCPIFSSGSTHSQRRRVKKLKQRYADVEAVLPEITRVSGAFKVESAFTLNKHARPSQRPGRPSLTRLSSGVRRLLAESKDAGILWVLRKVVYSNVFNALFAGIVVAHAVFIGYEADWIATTLHEDSTTFMSIHICFNMLFLSELIVRMLVECNLFFTGVDWKWNVLDFVVVILSAVDFFVLRNYVQLTQSGGIRTLRFARIVRVIRTVRLLRTVKSVHELHKMLYAVLSSMRTLICSSFILGFVTYFFTILFTAASAEQRIVSNDEGNLLDLYYGTLGRTCRSLFWAVSDGISWSVVYEPVAEIHWTYGFCFFIYIIIVTFGVMNVVTSVFVESAFLSAQHYRDVIVKDKEHSKAIVVGHIKAVFMQIDADGSGEISVDEMEYFLADPELRKYFEALELSADDARMIFRLLDEDGSGVIDMDEFCEGRLKLRGEAKSFDMHMLLFQISRFLRKWSGFTEYVEDKFAALDRALSPSSGAEPQNKAEPQDKAEL